MLLVTDLAGVGGESAVSDLGLGHDVEVVVVRGEGHVSEDGPVVHRLHRLVLQSQGGAVHADLRERDKTR